jgi:hypothetical protein
MLPLKVETNDDRVWVVLLNINGRTRPRKKDVRLVDGQWTASRYLHQIECAEQMKQLKYFVGFTLAS